jgi:hypothetical protein
VVCNDDAAKFGQATCDISFGGDYTEAFVSLALINPTGKHMPGAGVGLAANTHASGSHAKFPWLQGNDEAGNSSYHDNDIVIPNLNGGKFSLIGNGGGTIKDGLGGTNPTWWTFGEWNRMTTWLKAGADPDMDSGQTYFEGMSHTGGKFVYSSSTVSIFGVSLNRVSCTNGSAFLVGETVTGGTSGATGVVKSTNASYLNLQHGGSMDSATPVKFIIGETITGGTSLAVGTTTTNAYGEAHQHSSKHSWPQINLPGYYRPIDSTSSATYPHGANTQIVFDDFYVAVGANSAARVELGNASTYAACTKLALCDYSAWSNTSITAKARCADINLGADVWLFVTLADNTTQYTYKVL